MAGNRQKATEYLLKHIQSLDPSGTNRDRYKQQFSQMSDKEFDQFVNDLRSGITTICLYAPNMKIVLKLEDIIKTAKMVGLSLFERVRMYDEATGKSYLTNERYPILKLPVRRARQFLLHKLSVGESDRKLDALTGQVVKPDRASALSQVEAQILYSRGLKKTLVELVKVRGGDVNAYVNANQQLTENGTASLNALEPNTVARSAVVAKVLLRAMMLDNNIVEG